MMMGIGQKYPSVSSFTSAFIGTPQGTRTVPVVGQ
jgi:hypothetical protein